jgi:ribonuclease E
MVVNDLPGEECRVAILQDNHLEELYTERARTATNVGNIYKGRVTNVEPAIQAAFVDYGEGQSGFLHVSDLHPKYFPGQPRTERVGHKIPRRQRPPMQEALRRGSEVLVQVMKEGIGTKGPTLTSYLSIPGRLLVMMPDMDRVGVSRKVEDEEQRRAMREILDTLDLPPGFGFILRTAGMGQTKTELKRDAAYLQRLWKAMDSRMKTMPAPCELYTESDLLIRTIRDVLRPSIQAIIVDSVSAYERATAFLRVVAPRSSPGVVRYTAPTPLFHAFDVERQIELIHARTVPLRSGGSLVIDQTEALVAIDVNSGRSRGAQDAESNAYHTNCEAVDEIARQLRLRDLGGVIINDLIDMRSMRNRRLIEDRFRQNLKRDRARTTTLRISDFGVIEMTRQRMRPGISKSDFVPCPACDGHGEIKAPEYLGAYAVRHAGYLLQHEQVARVEIACSPRVASFMLSSKRRALVELEDQSGKRIDVRVSEAIGANRVDFYAYDRRNADIDIEKLPAARTPSLKSLLAQSAQIEPGPELPEEEAAELAETAAAGTAPVAEAKGRRRRRRGGRRRSGAAAANGAAGSATPAAPLAARAEPGASLEEDAQEDAGAVTAAPDGGPGGVSRSEPGAEPGAEPGTERGRRSRRRRRGRRRRGGVEGPGVEAPAQAGAELTAAPRAVEAVSAGASEAAEPAEEDAGEGGDTALPARERVRVHRLAKQLGVTSRQLIRRCRENGIDVKNHMSTVKSEEAGRARAWFASRPPAEGMAAGPGPAPGAGAPASAPASPPPALQAVQPQAGPDGQRRKKRRSRRRGRGGGGGSAPGNGNPPAAAPPAAPAISDAKPGGEPVAEVVVRRPLRTLYRNRKKLTAGTLRGGDAEEES